MALTEREQEIYRLRRVERLKLSEIAERFAISQQRVSQIMAEIEAKLPPIDIAAVRQASIDLHEEVQRRAFELAALAGAPVTSGKDGDIVRDPETQAVVRDYAGRITALKLALEADREIRKLLGADAASKAEVTGQVKYVLEGVNTDDLA